MTPSAGGGQPLLQARGLRKAFGPQVVLDDLDLEVEQGECVVLIGGSGSGTPGRPGSPGTGAGDGSGTLGGVAGPGIGWSGMAGPGISIRALLAAERST